MIKYNNNTINDWNFGTSNVIKVYRNNAIVFYKVSGDSPTPEYKVCFAVVDDISQYADREFEDVFDNATEKWYKLNNLNQYEEYGLYGDGRNITYYKGKLTIDEGYEYEWNGSSWVSIGEVSGSTIPDNYVIPFEDSNVKAICVSNWGGNVVAGELTYGEAKQVTNIGTAFRYNGSITSFNELAYFHSLTELSNGEFAGCTNLTDIVIPSNVTKIGYSSSNRNTFSGCTNLSGITILSGDETLLLDATANNGSYYMNSSHSSTPMIFPDRIMTFSGATFGYYDYLTMAYFQCSTPPVNLANSDINNYNKLQNVYCPVGSLSAYQTALAGKNKTIQEYDFETDSLGLLDKEKEWIDKTSSVVVYPKYYSEKSEPLDNITFNTMAEAQTYAYNNCVYDGMKATIDGKSYYFDSSDENGWVENESRLPQGYTEVEYVQNYASTSDSTNALAYINTNFTPTQNTRTIGDIKIDKVTKNPRIFGSGNWNILGYIVSCEETIGQSNSYIYYKYGQTSSWYTTSVNTDLNRHVYDLNNNGNLVIDNNVIASLPSTTFTCDASMGIFTTIRTGSNVVDLGETIYGKLYSFKVYESGTLVRDLVPCINPSNVVGVYDIVNDVFYGSANGNSLIAGNPI